MIPVSVARWRMADKGWSVEPGYSVTPDVVNGAAYLYKVYAAADPTYSGRVTAAVLWDKARSVIISNEPADVIRMLNNAFDAFDAFDALGARQGDYYPKPLRAEIYAVSARDYDTVNNGVYKAGFATTQAADEEAVVPLFHTLDALEARLSTQRVVCGDQTTEADWRLFTMLVRFDPVYVDHFKCNRRRIANCPNLSGYLRELFQRPGVAGTFDLGYTKKHDYGSHGALNPTGVAPTGLEVDSAAPHHRARLSRWTADTRSADAVVSARE